MKSLKVGGINARFENIELDFGLVIESFEIAGKGACATIDPFNLELPEPGIARVVVTEAAVAQLLIKQAPAGLKDFVVTIVNGAINVEAKAQIVVSIPVKAICTISIEGKKRLMVQLQSVDVMGGAAKNLVENQLSKINPIFDCADLPIEMTLDSVELNNGRVVVLGHVLG